MNNNPLSLFLDYTAKLLKQYNAIKQDTSNILYRIIEVKKIPQQEIKLVIQLIGKSTYIEVLPKDLVNDDNLLEGFSKKDVRTITFYACNQSQQPKFKIVSRMFCEKLNKLKFKIMDKRSCEVDAFTANEIFNNTTIITELAPQDLKTISYTAGFEHANE